MLNRFTLKPPIYKTFAIFGSLGREMILFPLICDLLPSPKVTLPHFLDSKTLKRDRSPIMCLEQSLSRYHKHVSITLKVDFIMKHTSRCSQLGYNPIFSEIILKILKKVFATSIRSNDLYPFT